ncbi:MAG TPA: hypothetical protein VFU13_06835 [Steroidobacteraceae bacterium]|nr:hypothetical protein [Steroidobacteraceae bacterium]
MATNTSTSQAATPAEIPEAGKTTIDDKMRFGPLRMAYESANALALDIANTVADKVKEKTVVIAGTQLLADYANLQAALLSLKGLEQEYKDLATYAKKVAPKTAATIRQETAVQPSRAATDAAAAAAPAVVTGLVAAGNPFVAAAMGALALLKTDVEFRGVETRVDRLAFELAVANAVASHGAARVFVPDFMLLPLAEVTDSTLRTALDAVGKAKTAAWLELAPLIRRVLDLEVDLEKAVNEKKADEEKKLKIELDAARANLEPINTPIMRADQLFDDLQSGWRKIETGEQLSTLARMLRIEAIDAMKPVYLHCAVVESGGHHKITRNLFTMIFFGDGLSFEGGAIARWALLSTEGAVERGGMITARRGAVFQDKL